MMSNVEAEYASNSLASTLAALRASVAAAASRAGRAADEITLVGVSKKQSRAAIDAAVEAGVTDIAESYVQEAVAKLAGLQGVRRHFIGHVQTNKAKAIVETFDVVQSIDRLDAGRAVAKASRSLGKRVSTLLQINISATERFGCDPADAKALAAELRDGEGLEIDGIMAIGPNTDDRREIARAFALAAAVFAEVGGNTLSIGMSTDYEEAIACGSTMVRIGTALFGART
jgi:pyridoxal phosphate enzyme (YggS family)